MARQAYELGLGLTEEHRDLAAAVADLANGVITPEVVRQDIDSPTPVRLPAFWSSLVDYDLLGLHVTEDHGGAGGGLLTLAVALEALGRHAAPGPYVPTVLASALVQADGGKQVVELLPKLVDGSTTAAVALASSSERTGPVRGAQQATSVKSTLIDLIVPRSAMATQGHMAFRR